jgi:hypothetical protein
MKRCLIVVALALASGCTQLSTSFVQSQRQWYEKSAKPHMLRDAAANPADAQQINDSLAAEDLNLRSAERAVGIATTQPAN